MDYRIADIALAPSGEKKIGWPGSICLCSVILRRSTQAEQPLAGTVISACLHLEAKTACLLLLLKILGQKSSRRRAIRSPPRTTCARRW